MKRFIAAFLACILVVGLSVPQVSASSSEEDFFDVLEFSTANDSGSQRVSVTSLPLSVTYDIPNQIYRYVDMVISTTIPDITISVGGTDLTRLLISSSPSYTYRFYGNFSAIGSGSIKFDINGSSGTMITFMDLKVKTLTRNMSFYPTVGGLYLYPSTSTSITYMTNATTPITKYINSSASTSGEHYYREYLAGIYLNDWKKYDYIDVVFDVSANSIDSISCSLDDVFLPYEISYLDSGSDIQGELDDYINQGNYTVSSYKTFHILMRIDLTSIDRTSIYLSIYEGGIVL